MATTKKAGTPTPVKKEKQESFTSRMAQAAKAFAEKRGSLKLILVFLMMMGMSYACDSIVTGTGTSLALLVLLPDGMAMSGRSGSIVHMRNGVRRNFVVPALVQNSYTTPIRAAFSAFSAGFRALTQAQIDAWNSASGFTFSDVFGRQKVISGKALYVRLNQNLFNAGEGAIADPPLAGSVDGIVTLSIGTADISSTDLLLTFTATPTAADVIHLVEATGNLSAGVSRPRRSDFRVIGLLPVGTATGADMYPNWLAKFGAPVAGAKVFIRLTPINKGTGQAGGSIVAGAVWVA